MDIYSKTIKEISEMLINREIGVVELTRYFLDNIKQKDKDINCYITVCEEEAIRYAENAQKIIDTKDNIPPLCGIPFAIKDNICTEGIKTTCASKMLENFKPTYSSTVVKKLVDKGAVILGKLNMDEFAMGCSSESSYFGPVYNPWDTDFVAGGSSGGSAAAIAADLAGFTLGSDTGGSIRQPAAFCGVVGLKPTYGLVSRYGLIAFASSLDQIGPMTRDVTDCAIVLNAIAGYDPMDSTTVNREPENYLEEIDRGVSDIKIGMPEEFFNTALDTEIKETIMKIVELLVQKGACSYKISIPSIKHTVSSYYLISSAEASSNLAGYDGIRFGYRNSEAKNIDDLYKLSRSEGFGLEVKRRIFLGTYALSTGHHDKLYEKALNVRRMISNDYNKALEKVDCIIAPVYPTTAFKAGENNCKDPLKMYLSDIYTCGVNLAGLPALTVPCGLDKNGLPIGMQIIGKAFSEKLLLKIGRSIEEIAGRMLPGR
ncbi:MAG: Asp-tRNA(Asn)/Glu-tRNA(Gln) amidotransferase subunit GatA [Clostridiaceae bacterium]|nr:Asp-tRNA(Asn)/Glu-tRNA(Gln) amidotransferase subunit GatA [Clostridiaceae bacterium]